MVGFQTKPSTPFTSRFENSDVDYRLRQKFQFFLQDLIRNATIANTVLPINVLDDRGSVISIQNFLKRSGPKYIFQFIQTNAENSPLVRSGFSLIIVCLSYLRRLQLELSNDEGAIGGVDNKFHYMATPQAHHALTNLQQKTAMNHFLEEKAWVSQAMSKINDSISVSSCMSIFVTTHDALAQELILNCVMNLMFASEDSVVQMLTPPAVFNKSNRALDEKEKQQLLNGTKRPHSRAATSETMMSKNSSHPFGASSNNLSAYNVEAAKASFRGDNPGSRNRVSSSFSEVQNGNNNNSTNDGSTNNGLSTAGNNDERRASATLNSHMSASGKIEDGWMDPSQHNCLSYMLAVAVLQKNRHSLLAAAAEVIIVMAKDASQGLCESIARANTCPLPLLSAVTSLSSNGGRRSRASGSSSMRKMSGSYDDETVLMPINPLTAGKVIDWAGIKIFLKFLHKYHSLMSSKDVFMDLLQQQHQLLVYENPHEDKNMLTAMAMNNLTGLRASLTNGAVSRMGSPLMGGSLTAGVEEGELITSSKMLSEELQREFLAVHDRVFVALCFLIKGSPTAIAPFILSLPGALDILRLSSIIFQERKQDHNHMAGYDMASTQSSVSSIHHQGTASSPTDEMEDAAVNIAMNTLQLEKQRMSRRHRGPVAFNGTLSSNTSVMSLDHMIYTATGGVVPSTGQNSLGHKLGLSINLNETGSLSTGSGPATGNRTATGNTSRGQSAPSPLARGFGNVKNQGPAHRKRVNTANGSSNGGSVHGKKLQPLGPPITLSPSKVETLSTPVTLAAADNHQKAPNIRPFEAPIPIQTETKSLYKQNQLNRQQVANAPASDLQYLAVNRIVHTAQAPLHAPQSVDSLLDTSLQIIDREAKESVIHGQPQKERLLMPAPVTGSAAGRHPLLTDSVLNFDPSASSTMQASQSQLPPNGSISASQSNLLLPRPSTSSPTRLGTTTGMAATRDFFGALPTKPIIPKRIEAQDAIIPGESMEIIRRKFQQIANGALNQIKSSGSVFNNGKNAMSLTERARRVYSPKRAGSSTTSGSGAATSPTTRDSPDKAAALAKKQSSGLQPLSFLDETGGNEDSEDDEDDSWANRRRRTTRQSTDSPTAAAAGGEGSDIDPEKTPAWNPRPEGLAYYGIRLDNVEFEEQDLFEHFKPIFGYEEHHDNVGESKTKTNNADLYEQQQNPHGAFHATRGKIAGELEQTGDLLLL